MVLRAGELIGQGLAGLGGGVGQGLAGFSQAMQRAQEQEEARQQERARVQAALERGEAERKFRAGEAEKGRAGDIALEELRQKGRADLQAGKPAKAPKLPDAMALVDKLVSSRDPALVGILGEAAAIRTSAKEAGQTPSEAYIEARRESAAREIFKRAAAGVEFANIEGLKKRYPNLAAQVFGQPGEAVAAEAKPAPPAAGAPAARPAVRPPPAGDAPATLQQALAEKASRQAQTAEREAAHGPLAVPPTVYARPARDAAPGGAGAGLSSGGGGLPGVGIRPGVAPTPTVAAAAPAPAAAPVAPIAPPPAGVLPGEQQRAADTASELQRALERRAQGPAFGELGAMLGREPTPAPPALRTEKGAPARVELEGAVPATDREAISDLTGKLQSRDFRGISAFRTKNVVPGSGHPKGRALDVGANEGENIVQTAERLFQDEDIAALVKAGGVRRAIIYTTPSSEEGKYNSFVIELGEGGAQDVGKLIESAKGSLKPRMSSGPHVHLDFNKGFGELGLR
jgi:hypothetical protein